MSRCWPHSGGRTRWRDIALWLVAPLAYLAFVLLRAPIAGEVPYPFLDVAVKGLAPVAVSALMVAGLFLVISIAFVLLDRPVSRDRPPVA